MSLPFDAVNKNSPAPRSIIAACFLLLLLVTYLYAFISTGRAQDLGVFDSFKAQDAAQIARNTARGQFLQTKYILPVGYSFLNRLEGHPDYVRYPLSSLIYALLFLVFPASPVTVKILNGLLFLLNSLILANILHAILEARVGDAEHPDTGASTAWTVAVLSSILMFPYFRFALGDVNEVLVVTVMLATVYALVRNGHPLLLGALCFLLYLSRPNMGLLAPFVAGHLWMRGDRSSGKIRAVGMFAGAFAILLLPFVIRNVYYTGKAVFSLQQYIELDKEITGSHAGLYRSFGVPGPVTDHFRDKLPLLWEKLIGNCRIFVLSSLRPYVLPAWLGLPFFFWLFGRMRRLLVTFLLFVLAHTVITGFLMQSFRINVPIYFPLTAFGYAGLIAAAGKLRIVRRLFPPPVGASISRLACVAVICFVVVTGARSRLAVVVNPRANIPSGGAVEALRRHEIECVYSNIPFWISWYADIIAIYAPVDMYEVGSQGPPGCRHFIEDERYPLEGNQRMYLQEHGDILEEGDSFTLYALRIPSAGETAASARDRYAWMRMR